MSESLDVGCVMDAAKCLGYCSLPFNEQEGEGTSRDALSTAASTLFLTKNINKTNIAILVYLKTHAMGVFAIEDDGVKVKGPRKIDGPWSVSDPWSHSGELDTDALKTIFVVKDASSIDIIRTILSNPLKYGKDHGLSYTRRRMCRISDVWVPQLSPDIDLVCSNCGKTETDESITMATLQACGKCKAVVYCGPACQKNHWREGHKKVCSEAPSLTDSAYRWTYVAVVTGLATDEDELALIARFCNKLDRSLCELHLPPNVNSSYTLSNCGSICTLARLLHGIGVECHGAVGVGLTEEAVAIREGTGQELSCFIEDIPNCQKRPKYLKDHGEAVNELRGFLGQMRPDLRVQLLAWQFQRIRSELKICLVNAKHKPIETVGKAYSMRNRIVVAHRDYSLLVYGEDPEYNVPMDYLYGLFTTFDDDSDLENEDDDY